MPTVSDGDAVASGADDDAFLSSVDFDRLAKADGPEVDAQYARLIDILIHRRKLVVTECHAALKVRMNLNNYNWFAEQVRVFRGQHRVEVLTYILEKNLLGPKPVLRAELDEALFDMLAQFIGIKSMTISNAPKYLTGTYQLWRYSVSTPGAYTKGMLQIQKNRRALRVAMHQRYHPTDPVSRRHHLGSRSEHLKGFILRQSGGRCVLILSDRSRRQVRFSIFSGVGPEGESSTDGLPKFGAPDVDERASSAPVFSLTGVVMGIDDGRPFVSPLYVEKVDNGIGLNQNIRELWESLNIYEEREVPSKVLANLKLIPLTLF